VADDRTSAVPADAAGTAPSGACEGGVALAPDALAAGRAARSEPAGPAPEIPEPAAGGPATPAAVPPVLAVPQVQVIHAFQMLGSDDVGVCVDGVCAVPAPSTDSEPAASTADTEQD